MSQIFNIVEELEKERKKNKELEEKQIELQNLIYEVITDIEGEENITIHKIYQKLIDNVENILKGDNKYGN